jgi:hypothetical protein
MSTRPLTFLTLLLTIASLGIFASQQTTKLEVGEDFQIEGIGLWQCQCPSHGCPCQTNGLPKHGTCYAADFAHINKGQYGKVTLDGLNVVLVGNLVDANPGRLFSILYLDNKATPDQREALLRMMEYLNGQYVSVPGEQAVPFNKVKTAAFDFSESPDRTTYALGILDILEERAVLKRDSSDGPLSTITAMDTWSNVVHNADSLSFKYHDTEIGKSWDYSGHYANLKYFQLTKRMYANREMLGQHGDMSGKWTAEQEEIIHRMGLDKTKQRP